VAARHPEIQADDRIVDNMCMQLVVHPQRYDMVVMENLYGDIMSDLAAGLVGGLGVVPGANIGEDMAVFEAVHGSAPDIAGQNKANPLALIQTAVLMLRHLGEKEIAHRIDLAIAAVLRRGIRTGDVGGSASTSEFTAALVGEMEGA
jgi:isocitrate dehydrogenase (NAD+)